MSTHARNTDPDTSHAAAVAVHRTKQQSIRARLLAEYGTPYALKFGLTSDEAMRAAGFTKADGVWKRVSDLARDRLIVDSGIRRPGDSGRMQVVWAINYADMVQP